MYLKVCPHLISHQAQAQERNALVGLFSGSGQSTEDFHADVPCQVRPCRVVEDESADDFSLVSFRLLTWVMNPFVLSDYQKNILLLHWSFVLQEQHCLSSR